MTANTRAATTMTATTMTANATTANATIANKTIANKTIANTTTRKVLMVITGLSYGGAETQVVALAQGLRGRGWEVSVVSLVDPAAHVDRLEAAGISVHSLRMKRRVADPRAIVRLARLIRREKPDVVHSHMVHANLLSRVTRCFARVPVLVCTAHNTRESSERGGPTWHKELLYRITDRLCDQTTIICAAGRDRYIQAKAAPASRLRVIPIGVDCRRFAPSPEGRRKARQNLSLSDDQFVFLTVGRMVPQKDYPNLLQALSLLRDLPWTLLVAGTGPLEASIRKLSKDLALSERLRFLGVSADARAWYHAADAFALSSQVEGMPVVLIEAAASGLPAIATDVGGVREVVDHGATGFVVSAADHVALAGALRRMLELSAADRAAMAVAARRRAAEQFDLAPVLARWESLYEACAAPAETRRARRRVLVSAAPSKARL